MQWSCDRLVLLVKDVLHSLNKQLLPPTSVPHLSALSKGLGEADKPLMRARLIWPGRLCSTSFLPATILLLLRSCQRFRGPRHLSALLPPSSRVRLLPSHW